MDRIDEMIYTGKAPTLRDAEAATPAPAGHSYYWDHRAKGREHDLAVRLAAREMGASLASLQSVTR